MASESESEEPVSGGTSGQAQEPGRKDKDARGGKFDSRFLGSLVTAGALLVVAIMGGMINKKISERQRLSDAFALQTNRETALDSLRADVFAVLAQHVVTELKSEDFKKVALLAAYHGSFSKHIDTRPVFEPFLKEVPDPDARHELRRLAKRVARRQADYIVAHGGVRDRLEVHWRRGLGDAGGEFDLGDHGTVPIVIKEVNDKDDDGEERPAEDVANTVDVVFDVDGEKRSFSVSYLDAPYIDNIFLVHSATEIHRIALLLLDITKTGDDYVLTLEALHFPENSILPGDVPSAQQIQKAHKAKILPGDVPSAREIQKPVDESDSHEAKEHHDAESS